MFVVITSPPIVALTSIHLSSCHLSSTTHPSIMLHGPTKDDRHLHGKPNDTQMRSGMEIDFVVAIEVPETAFLRGQHVREPYPRIWIMSHLYVNCSVTTSTVPSFKIEYILELHLADGSMAAHLLPLDLDYKRNTVTGGSSLFMLQRWTSDVNE